MRIIAFIVLLIFLVFVVRELYLFYGERKELGAQLGEINQEVAKLEAENTNLESDIGYYSHEDNLEKEARSELNYKANGEKLIIVVPQR